MVNESPLFSVIIPVYDTVDYVEACIQALLDQSFRDFEIIAVDDGSTDGSRRVLDVLAQRDARLRVFSKENGGQGAARNYGLAQARGRYVAFVDSDDRVSPDLFATVSGAFSDTTVDVVSFGVAFVAPDGRVVARRGPKTDTASTGKTVFVDALLDRNFYSVVWNKVYRRSLLQDNGIVFPELRAYEDSVFSHHVALYTAKVLYLSNVLYFALTRSGSTSRGMTLASFTRAAEMLALERRLFGKQFADRSLHKVFRAHVAHFLAYLTVLAAFRIEDADERAACRRIADEAGFRDCAADRPALALLGARARAQVFLAQRPRLLRAAAVAARGLGRVPY